MRRLLLLVLILTASIHAEKIIDSKKATSGNEKGFYYYDDFVDSNETEPSKKRVSASPAQRMQGDLTKQLIMQMKINNKLQEKILKKLEYAFPNTIPEFTVNKKTGEKCKSNSSADCFVMPVITEAQNSVPIMADMLRNPSSENVKKYMEWQAAYFNQSFKIGRGFSLVNKQYERAINKTDGMSNTQMPTDSNKQLDMGYLKKSATLRKLGDKIGVMFFVGKSKELERNFTGKEYTSAIKGIFGDLKNITYIYNSQADKDLVEAKIKRFVYDEDWEKYSKVRAIVDSKQYERFKITSTPSAVAIYKKDDGTILWQKLGHSIAPRPLLRTAYNFLLFHDIVKPGAINEKDNWEMADTLRQGTDFTKEQLDSIKIDESSINVSDDQILVKPKKEN